MDIISPKWMLILVLNAIMAAEYIKFERDG